MVVFDGFLKTEVYFENVGMVLRMLDAYVSSNCRVITFIFIISI